MYELEEIRREVYPPAPFGHHGEESTSARADEDDEDGADSQVEVGTCAAATTTVLLFSNLKHFSAGV